MIKVNGTEIKITRFPNGEANVDTDFLNTLERKGSAKVDFKWEGDCDILHLIFVLEHLKELSVTNREIYIYYLPYSRMDRKQNGNCFTLQHLTTVLNNVLLDTDKVFILEPHSAVSTNIKNSNRYDVITPLTNEILKNNEIDIICYPDKGARDRFGSDNVSKPLVYCNKKRDFNTGKILGLELVSDVEIKGKNILIIDDLCSKGGTFYYTSKLLKEKGVNKIFLGICHMEATVLQGEIIKENSDINRIFCFDTMLHGNIAYLLSENKCTVYNTEEFINNNTFVEIG